VHHSKIGRRMNEMGQSLPIDITATRVQCPLHLQDRRGPVVSAQVSFSERKPAPRFVTASMTLSRSPGFEPASQLGQFGAVGLGPAHFSLNTLAQDPDLIARLSNHSTAPSGAAFRRPTMKITIHAIATSKRQPPTNMATRPGFSLTISPGRVGKISEVVAKLFHLCTNHINH
jgi:hypothetical protein